MAAPTEPPPATLRLRMKIDSHEFEAEGPSEVVLAQLQTWGQLTGLSSRIPAGEIAAPPAAAGPDPFVSQLFAVDAAQQLVTLRASLHGRQRNANAALLLLFGFATISPAGNGQEITPTRLAAAMHASGYPLERVDRALRPYLAAGLVHRSGRRKQPAYTLTAAGQRHAAALAHRLCGNR
jgi:hypothetical protein